LGGSIALKLPQIHPDRLLSVALAVSYGFRQSDEQWDSLVVKKLVA
jgi:hypothetical protein